MKSQIENIHDLEFPIESAIESLKEVLAFTKTGMITTPKLLKERVTAYVDSDQAVIVGMPVSSQKDPDGYLCDWELGKLLKGNLRLSEKDERERYAKALESLAQTIRTMRLK